MAQQRKYRILVVDDDPIYRESECAILRSEGYEVSAASNPDEAQRILGENAFHLILIDNQMPDSKGELRDDAGQQLALWIKNHHPCTNRVIITSLTDVELVKKAVKVLEKYEGELVNDYFYKDDITKGRVGDLKSIVNRILTNRLVSVTEWSDYPHQVDPLDFWGEEGIAERDFTGSDTGAVSFRLGSMKACIAEHAHVTRIRKGTKVRGRVVRGGRVEVMPIRTEY